MTIVFDRYGNGSSIKTTERERWGSSALLPTYQIQGSRQVPNYRKFLKGAGNKESLANYISLYILEHATEYIPNGKSIILAGRFSEGMLVKEKKLPHLGCHPLKDCTVTRRKPIHE